MYNRSWTVIDFGQLKKNYAACEGALGKGQQIMAVVKADAYGHGDGEVAKCFADCGCKNFAVSNLDEARNLRSAGVEGQILILGYTPANLAKRLAELDITQALLSEEYADLLASECQKQDVKIKAQFAIDTGMNRIGLDADNVENCMQSLAKYAKLFDLNGIFTHFAVADGKDEKSIAFTKGQLSKFKAVAEHPGVKALNLSFVHCQNSAGGLFTESYGNLVRFGIVLYGLKPDYNLELPIDVRPALSWKSVISMVKTVHAGESIGYGCTFTAEKEMQIATVPTGYADGYSRRLSGCGKVLVGKTLSPVVGRVCMVQLMIDVSGLNVQIGEEVYLLSDAYNADDMAKDIVTIGYEIICGISKWVPKERV